MNIYIFLNHGSQIQTVIVIVHTPMTSLFKGAQLMNYAVWVLILLCCAATKCQVRQGFYVLFTLRCKIETSLGVFYSFFTLMEKNKISIACFSFRLCWNINWRDVQTKNVANNVDMSGLRAPWQNGPYKN